MLLHSCMERDDNVKEEVIDKILMLLMQEGIDVSNLKNPLYVALNDYEIMKKTTALAIRDEDRNIYCLQKFIIAKTVDGCTKRTLKLYAEEIKKILDKIGKTVDEIETDDVRYYLALRERRDGISKTTLDNELRYLKTFFNFLLQEEIIQRNPVMKIAKIRGEKIKKKAFTELEVEKIRSGCRTNRERAIVEILLSTGCRVSELVNIKLIEIMNDSILVHGKGKKDRICYLNAKAKFALEEYLKERIDENPYLFAGGLFKIYKKASNKSPKELPNWYQDINCVDKDKALDPGSIEVILRKIGRRVGVDNVHPHRFRRTCATFALRRGMSLEQVSKMLGHEQLSTTQVYLDLSEQELESAHRKYVV